MRFHTEAVLPRELMLDAFRDAVERSDYRWVQQIPAGETQLPEEIWYCETLREEPADRGFGAACIATLQSFSTGWRPALDDDGNPVADSFPFHCTFEIR